MCNGRGVWQTNRSSGSLFCLCWKVVEYVAREEGRVLSGRLFHLKAYSFRPDFYGVNHPQVFFCPEQIFIFCFVVKYL